LRCHCFCCCCCCFFAGGGFVSGDALMYRPTFKTWLKHMADQDIHMRIFAGKPLAAHAFSLIGC
jgi:hypothetical protein